MSGFKKGFIIGEETRPKIETFNKNDIENISKSIFYPQYKDALTAIAEHLSTLNEQKGDKTINITWQSPNNIFAFTGDRGSGKTSCMLSIWHLLCDEHRDLNYYKTINLSDTHAELLCNTMFYSCEVLDPLFFDDQHNILEIFIGTLFKRLNRYDKELKYENNHIDKERKREQLLSSFSRVKKNLPLLQKRLDCSEFDDLEQLKDLSVTLNFKESCRNLVQSFIEYMYNDQNDKNAKLVLCIDDMDLNMDNGYSVAEYIRKYLNMPELIILMAIKTEQLANIFRIHYSQFFKPILQEDKDSVSKTINSMVERYLVKLLPINHRINMPLVTDLVSRSVPIYKNASDDSPMVFNPLREGILWLIYKKTRMLFYNSKRQDNYIIPNNLRELRNLICLLWDLEDARTRDIAANNIERFKEYFFTVWCANNLSQKDYQIMIQLRGIINANDINRTVIQYLKNRFALDSISKVNDNQSIGELKNILDEDNMMFNISLGDVSALLDWIGKKGSEEEDRKLLFAIKTFYSFLLYANFRNHEEISQNRQDQREIINREVLTNNETKYGDIVNGNFFNSEYLNVAPYENKKVSRCRRIIVNNKTIYNGKQKKIQNLIDAFLNDTDTNTIQRKIAEFFMLTTSFVIDAKGTNVDIANLNLNNINYRRKNEVYYEKKIFSQRQYLCFDVLSILYNLANPIKTYKRFVSLTNMADNQEDLRNRFPLYDAILEKISVELTAKGKDDVTPEQELEYKLSFRNMEILDQISYRLQRDRPEGSSDNVEVLKNVFDNLSKVEISIYPDNLQHNSNQEEEALLKNNNQNITYTFFEAIKEFLDELRNEKNIKNLTEFNKIYIDHLPQRKGSTSRRSA